MTYYEDPATGPENDVNNQYASVLLELYLVKDEAKPLSPLNKARVNYWKRIVAAYERSLSERLSRRVEYRTRKAEQLGLNPVQIALVRYAWTNYFNNHETGSVVTRRWQAYLSIESKDDVVGLISFESFQKKRHFSELVREVKAAGLWPWV